MDATRNVGTPTPPAPPSLPRKEEQTLPPPLPPREGGTRGLGSSSILLLDLVLVALKTALDDPRDHRLFRSGKVPGLFPSRFGASAAAAVFASQVGLLETVRTEARGKRVIEWVRITPKGVGFVHDHDSPKAILRQLRDTIGATRAGLPIWLTEMREELTNLSATFESRVNGLTAQLDELTRRVEAALHRSEAAGRPLSDSLVKLVPWGVAALEYLDRRETASGRENCPLGELFQAMRERFPSLTVPEFHDGLRRLHDNRAVRLTPAAPGLQSDPEFALLMGTELCSFVRR